MLIEGHQKHVRALQLLQGYLHQVQLGRPLLDECLKFLDLLQTFLQSHQSVIDRDACVGEGLLTFQINRRLDPKRIIGQYRHLCCFCLCGVLSLLLQLFAHLPHTLLESFAYLHLQLAILLIDRARGFP